MRKMPAQAKIRQQNAQAKPAADDQTKMDALRLFWPDKVLIRKMCEAITGYPTDYVRPYLS